MKEHKTERVMKLERLLGTWKAIAIIIIGMDVLLFMAVNYIINLVLYLPMVVQDLDNPLKYLG